MSLESNRWSGLETAKESIKRSKARLNALDGKTWTRYSISIWDIAKTSEEARLRHPALFPQHLVERLLEIYTKPGDVVLDPFVGSGSTLLAALKLGRKSIGFDISPQYISLAEKRLREIEATSRASSLVSLSCDDAQHLSHRIKPNSIDLVVTSPPYWDIHHQRRTADSKPPRPYTTSHQDLGNISDYSEFLNLLAKVFHHFFIVVKPGRWCILIVMDLRKGNQFYPLHMDCIQRMTSCGFILEDIIIWDRRHEYHNLRPLGYPTTFRVNKVHEYILIFQKPSS